MVHTDTCNSDVQPSNQPINCSDGITEQQTATTHTHPFNHCSHRYRRRPSSEPATAELRNCPWSNLHKLFRRAFKAHELVDLVHCNTNTGKRTKQEAHLFYLPLNPVLVLLPTYLEPRKGRRQPIGIPFSLRNATQLTTRAQLFPSVTTRATVRYGRLRSPCPRSGLRLPLEDSLYPHRSPRTLPFLKGCTCLLQQQTRNHVRRQEPSSHVRAKKERTRRR